jgi:hypothetical protein
MKYKEISEYDLVKKLKAQNLKETNKNSKKRMRCSEETFIRSQESSLTDIPSAIGTDIANNIPSELRNIDNDISLGIKYALFDLVGRNNIRRFNLPGDSNNDSGNAINMTGRILRLVTRK